MWPMAA